MKITKNHAEGFTLDGVRITNNGINDVVSLSYNEMWHIFNHMQRINIKQQFESYLELRKDSPDYFDEFGRTAENMLADKELLDNCVEDINDGSYGDIDDDDIYRLLQRYA
ncbi:MAG: hypothetical protein RR806_07850 [Oscillospiraceae bacterium]